MQIIYYGSSSSSLVDSVNHYTHFTGLMLEEEIVAYLEVSGSTFKIRKMNVDTKIWGGEFLRGKGSKLIRLQYIKEWTVLYQN
jgi:hydrogenase maturation factor HypF (carbamoyltransferase family)